MAKVPVAAALPLLAALAEPGPERRIPLSARAPGWMLPLQPLPVSPS
jgi:hypothetical protein